MYVYIMNLNVYIQVATPLVEIATLTKKNVQRIIYLTSGQYYIVAKKDVLMELDNMSDAIFWFAIHYIFNILYTKKLHNVGLFFQDNIFGLSDGTSRSATYNSVVGDIRQYL